MLARQLSFSDLCDSPPVMLARKRIAITGYLPVKRADAIDALTKVHGIYASSVSQTTDILVIGHIKYNSKMDKAGSRKLLAAKKILYDGGTIQLMHADDFLRALDAADRRSNANTNIFDS